MDVRILCNYQGKEVNKALCRRKKTVNVLGLGYVMGFVCNVDGAEQAKCNDQSERVLKLIIPNHLNSVNLLHKEMFVRNFNFH